MMELIAKGNNIPKMITICLGLGEEYQTGAKVRTACGRAFARLVFGSFPGRESNGENRLLEAADRTDKSGAYRSARVGPAGPGGSFGREGIRSIVCGGRVSESVKDPI